MRPSPFNLARDPFRNDRPWRRLGAAVWILAGVLLVANAFLFWQYLTGSADRRAELTELREEIDSEGAGLSALGDRIQDARVDRQNLQVEFLNEKIERRRFPWSRLFEQLGEVLPRFVRLQSLSPQQEDTRRREQPQAVQGRVALQISGEARDGESLLELIDRLFEHEAFSEPKLLNESRTDTGSLRFQLTAWYLQDPPEVVPSEPLATETASSGEERPAGTSTTTAETGGQTGVPAAQPNASEAAQPAGAGDALAASGGAPAAPRATDSGGDVVGDPTTGVNPSGESQAAQRGASNPVRPAVGSGPAPASPGLGSTPSAASAGRPTRPARAPTQRAFPAPGVVRNPGTSRPPTPVSPTLPRPPLNSSRNASGGP